MNLGCEELWLELELRTRKVEVGIRIKQIQISFGDSLFRG